MRTTGLLRSEIHQSGERMRQARRGSADDEASRGRDDYDLPLAALSVDPKEEVALFILRSGEPEIGEGDGDLRLTCPGGCAL